MDNGDSGHKVIAGPVATKKQVSTWYAIKNSERRYWRGRTLRSSEWTLAISLAHKFKTEEEAFTAAASVGATKVVEVSGNTVKQIRRIRR